MYSSSKFTNWAPHDPTWSEIGSLPARLRPSRKVEVTDDHQIPIVERPLADGFVRPCSADEVGVVLELMPNEYLADLKQVVLLGGTAAQRRLRAPDYGVYSNDRIYLCAVTESHLHRLIGHLPKPSIAQRYTKMGVEFVPVPGGGFRMEFDQSSLRSFFLYDVLLHEIGHHVDRGGQGPRGERYAHWFADFQGVHLRKSGT
jgi:hypothetical protein